LPHELTSFGEVLLGPSRDDERPIHVQNVGISGTDLVVFQQEESHPVVHSDCWMRVSVIADSAHEAQKIVQQTWLPRMAAALSLASRGRPYRLEVIGSVSAEGRETAGPEMALMVWPKQAMDQVAAGNVMYYLEALQDNQVAATASQLLVRGRALHDSGGDPMLGAASLLAYHQCIEKIAMNVVANIGEDAERLQADEVRKLSDFLASPAPQAKKISAIIECKNALERIENKFLSLRIANAGKSLSMGPAWLQGAEALGKFRNRRLGHGNTLASAEEFEPWFLSETGREGRAYELAADLLDAFIRSECK